MTSSIPAPAIESAAQSRFDEGLPIPPTCASDTKLVAIVHLDMVSYSRLIGLDEAGTAARLRVVRDEQLRPLVAQGGGRVVDTAGDGALATFNSTAAAVRFALAFQGAVAAGQADEPVNRTMRFRIGITVADVLTDGTGVHGNGVNIAARLQAACPPGAVCVSHAVRDQVRDRLLDVAFDPMGTLVLRNIARPMRAYVVRHRRGPGTRWQRWRNTGLWLYRLAFVRSVPALIIASACFATLLAVGSKFGPVPPSVALNVAHATPREMSRQLVAQGRFLFYGSEEQPRGWLAAREVFQRAMMTDPDDPLPPAWAAFTYTNIVLDRMSMDAQADTRAAAMLAERAVKLDPNETTSLVAQAAVLRLQSRFAEALAIYRRVAASDDQYPSRANIGLMLVLLGRPAEAIAPIRSVLGATGEAHSFAGTWLVYLGMAQMQAGMEDFGAAAFRRAAARRSFLPLPELMLHLAAALALSGDLENARATLQNAQVRWPAASIAALRQQALSNDPAYLAQREALFRGLRLAGAED